MSTMSKNCKICSSMVTPGNRCRYTYLVPVRQYTNSQQIVVCGLPTNELPQPTQNMRQPNKILFTVTQDFVNNTSEADIFNKILKLKFKVIATIDLIPCFWQIQMCAVFSFQIPQYKSLPLLECVNEEIMGIDTKGDTAFVNHQYNCQADECLAIF